MLLAIDIGNTNVTLGLWDGASWREQWRLRTVRQKTADEYWIAVGTLLRDKELLSQISRVMISSVVPPLTSTFTRLSAHYLQIEPLNVTAETNTGIAVVTDNPQEVGADRIVNAAGAANLYDDPLILIDMGTATTFDVVSAEKELLGVVIAPGIRLAADALASRAAQLSSVALEAPPEVMGRNTIHSVQSGLVYGYAALVEGIVQRLIKERGFRPKVIGTGGLINIIAPYVSVIDHIDPWLTLTGLRVIDDLNRTGAE